MSKINKKTSLALGVMAALLLSAPAAFAMDVTTLPTKVANIDVAGATTVVSLSAMNINIGTSDLIIGRTTGFSVRIDLANGAKFGAVAAVPGAGAALTTGAAWTVTLAAGGGVGDNFAVYSVQPDAGSLGVINGAALTFAAGGIKLTNVGSLATAGGAVGATVTFADPVTAQPILTPFTDKFLVSANPLDFTVADSSNTLKRIDVGSTNDPSKTQFSSTGAVNGPHEAFFEAGTPTIGVATGVVDALAAPFAWAPADTVDLTVDGTFNAFTQAGAAVTLDGGAGASCTTPVAPVAGVITASKVTFAGVALSTLTGGAGVLCFAVPAANADVIDATKIGVSAVVTRTATTKTVAAGPVDAMAMQYNGPVAIVYTFNPAGNTTQQSFLRISNTGATAGLVTVTGRDDAGAAAAGSVSMTLGAGKSIQLTSDDLQNGNAAKGLTGALGAGAGKWILTVTGEVSSMEVTNLNRNNNSGTVSNLGTPVSGSF